MAATSDPLGGKFPGFFTQLYSLIRNVERKKFILQLSFNDVFRLLEQNDHSDTYKRYAIKRLFQLNDRLNEEQIQKIRTLFLNNFRQYTSLRNLEEPLVGFLAGAIEENVLGEYLKVALNHKSTELFKKCDAFIQSYTNFFIREDEYSTITFSGSHPVSDLNYEKAQCLIELIALHIDPSRIKIHLKIHNSINESMANFLIFASPYIRNLELHHLDDNTTNFILTRCNSLSRLWIKSKNITDAGLVFIEDLSFLESLTINYCPQIEILPKLSRLTLLRHLDISLCNLVKQLPPLNALKSLETLCIYGCSELESLPDISQLRALSTLNLSECRKIKNLPPLTNLSSLETITLMHCESLVVLSSIDSLRKLKTINLHNCKNLEKIDSLEGLENLLSLNLYGCIKLKRLPSLHSLVSLRTLNLNYCCELEELPDLIALTELRSLNLYKCYKITALPSLAGLTNLDLLCLAECSDLVDFPPFDPLINLSVLNLSFCQNLRHFPFTARLEKLVKIKAQMCPNLQTLPDLKALPLLTSFDLSGCVSLTQEVRINALHALLEENHQQVIKLLQDFEIEDTTSFERKLAEKDRALYLQTLPRLKPPNQEVRLEVLSSLLDTDFSTALNYLYSFAIPDTDALCEVLRSRTVVLEFMKRCEISLVDVISLPLTLSCFQAVLADDFIQFQKILTESKGEANLECVKDNSLLKAFILKHLDSIWMNNATKEFIITHYPADDLENEMFYPLKVITKEQTVKFKVTTRQLQRFAKEIIVRWGNLLEISPASLFPSFLDVVFYGQSGIDAGGLSRQFVSQLFQALVHHSPSKLFIRRINGFFIPHLAQKEYSFFEALGQVSGFLLNATTHCPIGELFDTVFFEKLKEITPEEVGRETKVYETSLRAMDRPRLLVLCDSLFNPAEIPQYVYDTLAEEDRQFYEKGKDTLRAMKQFFLAENFHTLDPYIRERIDYLHPFSDNLTEENFDHTRSEIFDEFIDVYLNQLLAIHAFARGIAKSLPLIIQDEEADWVIREWKDFCELPTSCVSKMLQGTLTKEEFKDSLEVGCADSAKEEEVALWLEEWLQSADIFHIRKFLIQVTGAPTLTGNIKISLSEQHEAITYSTCFSTMKLPIGIEKDTFFAELDALNNQAQPEEFNEP